MRRTIREGLGRRRRGRRSFSLDHHESHAASAFFPSPFDEAAILTLDGVGEWSTTTLGRRHGNRIQLTHPAAIPALARPAVLGIHLLLRLQGQQRRIQADGPGAVRPAGLQGSDLQAPHRSQARRQLLAEHGLLQLLPGPDDDEARFDELFGGPPRKPESDSSSATWTWRRASRRVTEEACCGWAGSCTRQTGIRTWCWPAAWRSTASPTAGCCAKGRSRRSGSSRPPATPAARSGRRSSSGTSSWTTARRPGAATRRREACSGPRIRPDDDRARSSTSVGAATSASTTRRRCSIMSPACAGRRARWSAGSTAGWSSVRGRSGARSILGDPGPRGCRPTMNLKIKFRESFRPFAPCVLREHVHEWFAMRPARTPRTCCWSRRSSTSIAFRFLRGSKQPTTRSGPRRRVNMVRSTVPAVTHVDYSARVQTVDERHGRFHRLLKRFHRGPAARSWSTRASTSVGADRPAPRRTPITPSCSPKWTCWSSRTACCTRASSRLGFTPGRAISDRGP